MTEQGTLFPWFHDEATGRIEPSVPHVVDSHASKWAADAFRPEFNSTAPEAAKPRLGRQQWAILERLRRGPTTNTELSQIAQRFSARIGELRDAGYNIQRTYDDDRRGVYVYELVGRAE